MNADEQSSETGMRQEIDELRKEVAALRQASHALTERADAIGRRADASEAREVVARDRADASEAREALARTRADASEHRQDIADDRADASEARELVATERVDALEALTTKHGLRIDDLETNVDIDRQMILELHDRGVLAQVQVDNLHEALKSSRMIGQALGIIMSRLSLTQEQAFSLLQLASNNTNRKLRDIADEIVLTGAVTGLN